LRAVGFRSPPSKNVKKVTARVEHTALSQQLTQ
jgi:hypothetical protein